MTDPSPEVKAPTKAEIKAAAAKVRKAEMAATNAKNKIETAARREAEKAAKKVEREAAAKAKAEAKANFHNTPEGIAKAAATAAKDAVKKVLEKEQASNAAAKDAVKKVLEKEQASTTKELAPIAREINVRFDKAARLESDADDHRLAAALRLAEARTMCDAVGLKFKDWAADNIKNQSYETIRKLVVVGGAENPMLALQDMRGKNAEANRVARKVAREAKASNAAEQNGLVQDPEDEGETTLHRQPTQALSGLDMLKAAFQGMKAHEKMAFLEWAAEDVGVTVNTGFDAPNDAKAQPATLQRRGFQ